MEMSAPGVTESGRHGATHTTFADRYLHRIATGDTAHDDFRPSGEAKWAEELVKVPTCKRSAAGKRLRQIDGTIRCVIGRPKFADPTYHG